MRRTIELKRRVVLMPLLRSAWLLILSVSAASATARADQVVTLCAFDNQSKASPADLNLSDAIALGGRITFRCGGPATIRFRQPHTLLQSTEIDGGKLVTLDGGGWRMFGAQDVRILLRLVDIAIVNGGKAPR